MRPGKLQRRIEAVAGDDVRARRHADRRNQRGIEATRRRKKLLLQTHAQIAPARAKSSSRVEVLKKIRRREAQFRFRRKAEANKRFGKVEALLALISRFREAILENEFTKRDNSARVSDRGAVGCDRWWRAGIIRLFLCQQRWGCDDRNQYGRGKRRPYKNK